MNFKLETYLTRVVPGNSSEQQGNPSINDYITKLPTPERNTVTGNTFDKYRSRNPLHRLLMNRFLASARKLLDELDFESVIEVGCGPGDLADRLFVRDARRPIQFLGIDVGIDQISLARSRCPSLQFEHGSAYELPATVQSFDLVVACEVLEHLANPNKALKEMQRVAKKWLLVSVPWEPAWRILNFARGKYVKDWGDTPGHIQHFSRREIVGLVSLYFEVVQVVSPFPWTMLLARKGS